MNKDISSKYIIKKQVKIIKVDIEENKEIEVY